jgi:hypothetical protein
LEDEGMIFGDLVHEVILFTLIGLLFSRKRWPEPEQKSFAPEPEEPEELKQLRLLHGVRLVTPEEEGNSTLKLPGGVYGFTYAPALEEVPLFRKRLYRSFEVHKLPSGEEHVVGYVTSPEAEKIESGADYVQIRLYPEPYEDAVRLVSIPVDRMLNAKRATSRDEGNYLNLEVDASGGLKAQACGVN